MRLLPGAADFTPSHQSQYVQSHPADWSNTPLKMLETTYVYPNLQSESNASLPSVQWKSHYYYEVPAYLLASSDNTMPLHDTKGLSDCCTVPKPIIFFCKSAIKYHFYFLAIFLYFSEYPTFILYLLKRHLYYVNHFYFRFRHM